MVAFAASVDIGDPLKATINDLPKFHFRQLSKSSKKCTNGQQFKIKI
jgi:hypothetical protein